MTTQDWPHDEGPHRVSRTEVGIGGLVVGILLSLLGWYLWGPSPSVPSVSVVRGPALVTVRHDTVVQVVPRPVVMVRNLPAKVVIMDSTPVAYADSGDTLIARPFAFTSDTIVGHDTVSMQTTFPPPRHWLTWRAGPDSMRTMREIVTVEVERAPPWYVEAAKISLTFLAGYAIRAVTEPSR